MRKKENIMVNIHQTITEKPTAPIATRYVREQIVNYLVTNWYDFFKETLINYDDDLLVVYANDFKLDISNDLDLFYKTNDARKVTNPKIASSNKTETVTKLKEFVKNYLAKLAKKQLPDIIYFILNDNDCNLPKNKEILADLQLWLVANYFKLQDSSYHMVSLANMIANNSKLKKLFTSYWTNHFDLLQEYCKQDDTNLDQFFNACDGSDPAEKAIINKVIDKINNHCLPNHTGSPLLSVLNRLQVAETPTLTFDYLNLYAYWWYYDKESPKLQFKFNLKIYNKTSLTKFMDVLLSYSNFTLPQVTVDVGKYGTEVKQILADLQRIYAITHNEHIKQAIERYHLLIRKKEN